MLLKRSSYLLTYILSQSYLQCFICTFSFTCGPTVSLSFLTELVRVAPCWRAFDTSNKHYLLTYLLRESESVSVLIPTALIGSLLGHRYIPPWPGIRTPILLITILVPKAPPSVGKHGGSCRNLGLPVTRGHLAKFSCPNVIPCWRMLGYQKFGDASYSCRCPRIFCCAPPCPCCQKFGGGARAPASSMVPAPMSQDEWEICYQHQIVLSDTWWYGMLGFNVPLVWYVTSDWETVCGMVGP